MNKFFVLLAAGSLAMPAGRTQPAASEALITKWRIQDSTARRMIDSQQGCDTCRFISWQSKPEVADTKTELRRALGIARINLRRKWVKGLYGPEDVPRYAALHGLPPDSDAARVDGYTTRLLRYRLRKRDRAKYSAAPGSTGYHPLEAYRLALLGPNAASQAGILNLNNKYIYFNVGRLCPPPNGCMP